METGMEEKRIIEYTVIYAYDLSNFRTEMERYLKIGWQPFWSLQVLYKSEENLPFREKYLQAIVKYWPLDSNEK